MSTCGLWFQWDSNIKIQADLIIILKNCLLVIWQQSLTSSHFNYLYNNSTTWNQTLQELCVAKYSTKIPYNMKRKFKQWLSTIQQNKQSPLTSNHWTFKRPWHDDMTLENQVLAWDMHKNVAYWTGWWYPNSLLDNWTSNSNTDINKW